MLRDFIMALGGPGAVAGELERAGYGSIGGDAVSLWHIRGNVPWKYRFALRQMAGGKSVEITPEVEAFVSLGPSRDAAE